ncbi:MAG TPA: DUF177 domain-containing protein [Gemmatimonadales bacterium]|jgi:uncharacterized protein
MLRLNVRDFKGGPLPTADALSPDDPVFSGLELDLVGPVEIDGTLQPTDGGDFFWRAHLRAQVAGECRRCLTDVTLVIDDDVDVLFSADPDLVDDPGVYELAADAESVDVTPAIREELALRVSAFPLCRADCKGLCATCGADLNAGSCQCARTGSTN